MRRADRLWYGQLFRDPDFVQRYADRWFELRGDALSDENMLRIVNKYRETIGTDAAERDGVRNWLARLSRMENWVTTRAEAIDGTFREQPTVNPFGGIVDMGSTAALSVSRGDIYFTMDGTDPRLPGGEVSPNATLWNEENPIVVESAFQLTARTLDRNRWSAPVSATFTIAGNDPTADLDGNGKLDEADIQLLCMAFGQNDSSFDLNADESVDHDDLDYLLTIGWNTTVGDANLDGVFNSTDLVQIFIASRYEEDTEATWSQGDWNCDGRFDSGDLVAAFLRGNYSSNAKRIMVMEN